MIAPTAKIKGTIVGFVISTLLIIGASTYPFVRNSEKGQNYLLLVIVRSLMTTTLITLSGAVFFKYGIGSDTKTITNKKNILQDSNQETKISDNEVEKIAELKSKINALEHELNLSINEELNQKELQKNNQSKINQLHMFINTALRIRHSLNKEDVLKISLEQIQNLFGVDRVVICYFDSDSGGILLSQLTSKDYPLVIRKEIDDLCFGECEKRDFRKGKVSATNDIYKAKFPECYVNFLSRLSVKSSLVAPILQEKHLFGLLISHQCQKTRIWEEWEINLFGKIAIQIGLGLAHAEIYHMESFAKEKAERAESKAEQVIDEQCHLIETLQSKLTTIEKKYESFYYTIFQSEGIAEALRLLEKNIILSKSINNKSLDSVSIIPTIFTATDSLNTATDQTIVNVSNLSFMFADIRERLNHLNEFPHQIYNVIALINQAVTQTNVLAVNTGLDYANSVQDSETFKVVTQEVCRLSSHSIESLTRN